MKGKTVSEYFCSGRESWFLKSLMKLRSWVEQLRCWNTVSNAGFSTREVYKEVRWKQPKVEWRKLFFTNYARPRACFVLWMVCLGKVYTKDRLAKFGVAVDETCCFYRNMESIEHLWFECSYSQVVWRKVLFWLGYDHTPSGWHRELSWVLAKGSGKTARRKVLRAAFAETTYFVWRERNLKIHEDQLPTCDGWRKICSVLAARCLRFPETERVIQESDRRCFGVC